MWVEVDMFSGRRNPVFKLSPQEEETIYTLLAELPDAAGIPPPAANGLGYRGFHIVDSQRNELATVLRTDVWLHNEARDRVKFDEARRMEKALVAMARPHLDAEVYAFLLSQLTP